MKRILIVIPSSHSWFWPQICLTGLQKHPPRAAGFECHTLLVDNSWEWSPSVLGITETTLRDVAAVTNNISAIKMHGSAIDQALRMFDCYYLMTLETDVLALADDWLQWFVDQMAPDAYAVGALREDGEKWLSVSCTLYRTDVLRQFNHPFAERRGSEWIEPGKHLCYRCRSSFHEVICPSRLTGRHNTLPLGTDYGPGKIVHLWAGSRASEGLRIPMENDRFVLDNDEFLLRREARIWLETVDPDVQKKTLTLIREHGFHAASSQGGPVTDRERRAAERVVACYRMEGLEL